MGHLCPWWHAYSFDNCFRRVFYNPKKLFGPYVAPGMTVLDVGCGMGFNAIALARLVGDEGSVIAVDVQRRMLDVLEKRARKAGVAHRICTRQCRPDSIGVETEVGFALAFWVVHEVPDARRFLTQVRSCLGPQARFLVVEPRGRVSERAFQQMLTLAQTVGLRLCDQPRIRFSRSALFLRD